VIQLREAAVSCKATADADIRLATGRADADLAYTVTEGAADRAWTSSDSAAYKSLRTGLAAIDKSYATGLIPYDTTRSLVSMSAQIGYWTAALSSFRRALQVEPDHRNAQTKLSGLLHRPGRDQEAIGPDP
jgi:hypothetical protein